MAEQNPTDNPSEPRKPPPGSLELAPGVKVDPDLVQFTYARSGGPGGQNVNKVSSKATLRLRLDDLPVSAGVRSRFERLASRWITADGEIVISSEDTRSQRRNREVCFEKLREVLLEALVPPKTRRPTRPSRGAKERRLKEKRVRSDAKRRRQPPEGE